MTARRGPALRARAPGAKLRPRWAIAVVTVLVAAAVVLAAVPAVLVAAVGLPFPVRPDAGALLSWHGLSDLIAVVAWVSWGACCIHLGRSVAARVRDRDVTPGPADRWTDRIEARIAAAVLAAVPLGLSASLVPTGSRADAVMLTHVGSRAALHSTVGRVRWSQVRRAPSGAPDETHGQGSPPLSAPELVSLGFGVLVAAILARRLRRQRQLARLRRMVEADRQVPIAGEAGAPTMTGPADDVVAMPPSDEAIDTATVIEMFAGSTLLEQVEWANRHLAVTLSARVATAAVGGAQVPSIRLVRADSEGVDLWLREPVPWQPDGWHPGDDGRVWHLPNTLEIDPRLRRSVDDAQPWLPLLLPVGEDDSSTWLIPLEPGECLEVLGSSARALVAAMREAVRGWAWSEQLTVTDDPEEAARAVELTDGDWHGVERSRVLFIGRPDELADRARSGCGVLTLSPVDWSDLTVVVDRRAATLHPLGLTLRPHLLDDVQLDRMTALLDDAALEGATTSNPPAPALDRSVAFGVTAARALPAEPGHPEVRLLTAVPRIDGLENELPAKRARRAVELVAYLALHRPDPVTSDRLRTRVLGSADADAAAKTLFNTATAARRALGAGEDGQPLLPPAGRLGHYRISDRVTVDTLQAEGLVAAAMEQEEPTAKIAVLRAALELVEGEPLSGALFGYSWWQAEGHAGHIAAVLVDAACQLSELAAEAGLPQLAQWGIERARLVEPYSEALSCAAMRVAAAAGDADRLRREWADCRRQVEELDPGGAPSERTAALYLELARATAVPAVQANLAAMEAAPRSTVPSAPAAL